MRQGSDAMQPQRAPEKAVRVALLRELLRGFDSSERSNIMAAMQLCNALRHLRCAATRATGLSDGQLLRRFAAQRDPEAFAALVERPGRLVLSVCRNVLGHEQDAEDAFQAVFLVLARDASSIRKPEALASWLHGVAYRVAMRDAGRRRKHESRCAQAALRAVAKTKEPWHELGKTLDLIETVARKVCSLDLPRGICCVGSKPGPKEGCRWAPAIPGRHEFA